ncbi:hypothetical protein [Oryza sativa Japonica Group]|uniref:Uncharacterized protein n=1 Tax=Oryza sativa subsp. japonica TaxID=39947 RepID=Q5QNF6_ORYSJ|nr:hypothetical protein [Oryza sativa Japonica Group]BAD73042.1 hypothetical protein [Oryza sativa Japonica Group]
MDDSGGAERRISPSQLRTTTSPSPSPPSPSLEDGWVSKPRMTAAREAPLPLNRLTLLLRINLELLSLDHLSGIGPVIGRKSPSVVDCGGREFRLQTTTSDDLRVRGWHESWSTLDVKKSRLWNCGALDIGPHPVDARRLVR